MLINIVKALMVFIRKFKKLIGLAFVALIFFYMFLPIYQNKLKKFLSQEDSTYPQYTQISTSTIYPHLFKCNNYYNNSMLNETIRNNYSLAADERLNEFRFTRGIVIYYPVEKHLSFESEIRWLYLSWIEMQKYEPSKWRTDLILFMPVKTLNSKKNIKQFFEGLNCKAKNKRNSKKDKPMCTIIDYVPVDKRLKKFNNTNLKSIDPLILFSHLYKDINVFDDDDVNIWKFRAILRDLSHYGYLDSIMVAFEGYKYFKFDFLLRTDMDVFLTPLFAKWLPLNCNHFITGRGAYSGDFNMKRIQKAAKNVNLKPDDVRNLGSTWYSTPNQFRIVSYLTLVSMVYLSNEEFSPTERKGKLAAIHWPDWHYGVVLLYGQNLAMNHLISSRRINIKKLDNLIDFRSINVDLLSSVVHIHVYHGSDMFSKSAFKAGAYNSITLPINDTHLVKYYCLSMALESKRMALVEFKNLSEKIKLQKF
jgi:hypothetical protein